MIIPSIARNYCSKVAFKDKLAPLGNGRVERNELSIVGWNVNSMKKVNNERCLGKLIDGSKPDWLCLNELKVNL